MIVSGKKEIDPIHDTHELHQILLVSRAKLWYNPIHRGRKVMSQGAITPIAGWALAFILIGALGLILVAALIFASRRAQRRQPAGQPAPGPEPEPGPEPPSGPTGPAVWGALWVSQEGEPVQVFQLTGPAVTLGRDPASDLCLAGDELAPRHAELRHESGAAVLYDLGSATGTTVNHTPLSGSRRLSPGDVIHLGATELVFRPPARLAGPGGRLVLTQGHSQPAQFDLSARPDLYIGCSESCDLVIHDDPAVSRRHAQIQRTPGGHDIVDLDSSAGLRVNGRTVSRAHLRPGDRIQLGDTELLYQR